MFERPHHQRIAHVLAALDGATLRQHGCLFGGGTERLHSRPGWLKRCMQVMAMPMPKAVLWQRLRALRRIVPKS